MPQAQRSPESSPVHVPAGLQRRLALRRISLRPLPDESSEARVERLETALMALFRDERSEAAFCALYELGRAPLFAWMLSLGPARLAALDIEALLQDTFVNIYRYAGSFRDEHPRSFRVWSRTIAGNVLRRAGAKRRMVALDAAPDGWSEPADPRSGPSEDASSSEERRTLLRAWMIVLAQYQAAYAELGERDRRALHLIEVEERSYGEACVLMGVGLSNMKMILFRARRRIRDAIGSTLRARQVRVERLAG